MGRVDFSALEVGDVMFLSYPIGWSDYGVEEYTVTRITPKGQITCESGNDKLKVSPQGRIFGSGTWDKRYFVTAENAAELRAQVEHGKWCKEVRNLALVLERAALNKSTLSIVEAAAAIAQAIEARSGETGTGSTEGESAVRQDAPHA